MIKNSLFLGHIASIYTFLYYMSQGDFYIMYHRVILISRVLTVNNLGWVDFYTALIIILFTFVICAFCDE